jgi:hypothetical protein
MTGRHPHPHAHPHAHSGENPYAGQGAVLLDIGGDIGALVVRMPARLVGAEVEIRPRQEAADAPAPHVAVVERPTAAGDVPTLVFPALTEGDYVLYDKGSRLARATTTVRGGAVTHEVWPEEDLPEAG